MPLNRRIMAADQELADKLSQLADKYNTSLYSLTNRIIESYILLEKSGYNDPIEAAMDIVLFHSIKSLGFHIKLPHMTPEDAKNVGKVIWTLMSSRVPKANVEKIISKLASLFVGDRNFYIESSSSEKRLIIAFPISFDQDSSVFSSLLDGLLSEAIGNGSYEIESMQHLIIIKLHSKKSNNTQRSESSF